jgi:hypothetical protein
MLDRILTWQSALDLGWFIFLMLLLLYFLRVRWRIQQAASWEKTKGQITRCEWITQAHRLWPKVEYLYKVGEREFMGEEMFYDTSHRTLNNPYARKVAYEVAQAFKNNEDVEVFYNPEEPDEAVLDITIPGKLNLILVLIGLLITFHLTIVAIRIVG